MFTYFYVTCHNVLYPLILTVSVSSLFPLISSPLPHILSSFSSCQLTVSPLFKEHPPPCFHHPLTFLIISFSFIFHQASLQPNLLHLPLITQFCLLKMMMVHLFYLPPVLLFIVSTSLPSVILPPFPM